MPRTTMDIDGPVLRDLKKLQKRRRKPLGKLINELLARVLADEMAAGGKSRPFIWKPRPMGRPRVDLRDKEAVRVALEKGGSDIP